MVTNQHIEVHIEELVLHGFDGCNASGIGDAVEREITRLLQEQGLPDSFLVKGTVDQLQGGNIHLQPHAGANTLGNKIGTSVFNGLIK